MIDKDTTAIRCWNLEDIPGFVLGLCWHNVIFSKYNDISVDAGRTLVKTSNVYC